SVPTLPTTPPFYLLERRSHLLSRARRSVFRAASHCTRPKRDASTALRHERDRYVVDASTADGRCSAAPRALTRRQREQAAPTKSRGHNVHSGGVWTRVYTLTCALAFQPG